MEQTVIAKRDVYAKRVGARLRAIRRQQGLSLQEVEANSEHEFKASVLGAYERGERVINVPRLQRLAAYYHVPVDQLLPRPPDLNGAELGTTDEDTTDDPAFEADRDAEKVTFDLSRFGRADDSQLEMVRQYLNSIQMMRQDFNGRVLTIRRDDIRAIAGLFGVDPGYLVRKLQAYRIQRDG